MRQLGGGSLHSVEKTRIGLRPSLCVNVSVCVSVEKTRIGLRPSLCVNVSVCVMIVQPHCYDANYFSSSDTALATPGSVTFYDSKLHTTGNISLLMNS